MSEKNKALINQIIRFGLVGISNTIVSYVIYAVAFALTDNYFLANVLSWLLSVLHAYIWQNVFVFKEDKNAQESLVEGSFKDVCSIRIYRAAAQQPFAVAVGGRH